MKRLLTVEQACERLNICRTVGYQLIGEGRLESVRIGTSRRIPEDAIDDFIDRLRGVANPGSHPQEGAHVQPGQDDWMPDDSLYDALMALVAERTTPGLGLGRREHEAFMLLRAYLKVRAPDVYRELTAEVMAEAEDTRAHNAALRGGVDP